MRRWILAAASAAALFAALVVGPFGVTATAPYVYGCTPAMFQSPTVIYQVSLSMYNGTASTAHVTTKILSGTGSTINSNWTTPLPLSHASNASGLRSW